MYTTFMLTIAALKMFLRNRQALFFSLFMPLMILVIFGSINFDKPMQMHLGVVTDHPSVPTGAFLEFIRGRTELGVHEGSFDEEMKALHDGDRTAVVKIPDNLIDSGSMGQPQKLDIYVNKSRPADVAMAMAVMEQVESHVAQAMSGKPPLFTLNQVGKDARNTRYIEFLLPGVIAMSVMQMSVFSVAFVFARYREQGVLKRLTATPMRAWQFVTANIITRLLMSCVQAAIFLVLGFLLFRVQVVGSVGLLSACVVLGSLMFLGLGFTISGLAKTIEAVPVFSNIVVFPMLFLGNVFFAVSNMPPWLSAFAKFLPLTFFASALRGVMTEGLGFMESRWNLLGMAVWAAFLVTTATITFRFQEQEG